MPSHRMPKQLLFGRIEGAKRAQHGLEGRWSDVVQEDVELSGLADDWYQRCQDRPQWRRLVKDATGQLEAVALQQQRRAEERRSQQRAERRVAKAQQVGTVGGTGGASASHLGHLGQLTRGTCWVCPVTSCQLGVRHFTWPQALQEGRSCELAGRVYQHGESFSVSCTHRCSCVDGAAGCAPLCPRPRPPLPPLHACPRPLLRRAPGTNACCLEWDCGPSSAHGLESGGGGGVGGSDEVVADAAGDILKEGFKGVKTLAAFRGSDASRLLPPAAPPAAAETLGACRGEPSPGWSPCSASCGRGRSTRLAGHVGVGCRSVRRTRACLVRPCGSSPRQMRRHRGDRGVTKDHHRSHRHRHHHHHRRRQRQQQHHRRDGDGGGCLVRPSLPALRACRGGGRLRESPTSPRPTLPRGLRAADPLHRHHRHHRHRHHRHHR
ncbi:uncharacterized protein LOC133360163 isoform X1 [Lethenteron reissneri]|uniref:uncharacterized protein LOC133360163 isoform X1 n=1 Tax=Lethenteron reissneri TaxID=7753 RepID=UPI002AB72F80|nr:uncharacterized protein LOC133360163 isoform X1 [Lethenteron reissneri]